MIYYEYSKIGLSLMAEMQEPEPLEEWHVRVALLTIIEQTLDYGENPYKMAENAEAYDGLHNYQSNLPNVDEDDEEDMNSQRNKEKLVDWIMTTEAMTEVLGMFSGLMPEDNPETGVSVWEMPEESVEERMLQDVLLNLLPTESD